MKEVFDFLCKKEISRQQTDWLYKDAKTDGQRDEKKWNQQQLDRHSMQIKRKRDLLWVDRVRYMYVVRWQLIKKNGRQK